MTWLNCAFWEVNAWISRPIQKHFFFFFIKINLFFRGHTCTFSFPFKPAMQISFSISRLVRFGGHAAMYECLELASWGIMKVLARTLITNIPIVSVWIFSYVFIHACTDEYRITWSCWAGPLIYRVMPDVHENTIFYFASCFSLFCLERT